MERKAFLQTGCKAMAALGLPWATASGAAAADAMAPVRIPPYLRPGDLIGITTPSGTCSHEAVQPAVQQWQRWGFQVRLGEALGKKSGTLGGTDEERLADLQHMLDDPQVRAIQAARGGYGLVRIIDRLDFTLFRKHPKWLIGFSDATVLHAHVHQVCRIATVHGKMASSFPGDWNSAEEVQRLSLESIRDCITGKPVRYAAPPHPANRSGSAEGLLIGGNLRILESLAGSASDMKTDGHILLLEDADEFLYNIDRMLWSLDRNGKLSRLKGLILGGFRLRPDDPGEEFGMTLEQVVQEKIAPYSFPVCMGFPVGHQKDNRALKLGVPHRLDVGPEGAVLTSL